MIQPLRRLHFRIIIGAALGLPIIFLSGLLARRSFPLEEFQFLRSNNWPAELSVQLKSFQDIPAPDLLVYWSPVNPASQALLPEARLLGSLRGSFYSSVPLPSDGYFLLYSLAHQKVLAKFPLDKKEKHP